MIDFASLVESLAYAGSALLIAALIRELRRPGGALPLADLLVPPIEPSPRRIPEEQPVRWNVERLRPRSERRAVTARAEEPVGVGPRRRRLADRPIAACEGG